MIDLEKKERKIEVTCKSNDYSFEKNLVFKVSNGFFRLIFIEKTKPIMGLNQVKIDDYVYQSIAKHTELRQDDIRLWHERFLQWCSPGSTTMNKEQFCKFYQELRPNENVKSLSENIFRAFDLNGDHGITFSEVRIFPGTIIILNRSGSIDTSLSRDYFRKKNNRISLWRVVLSIQYFNIVTNSRRLWLFLMNNIPIKEKSCLKLPSSMLEDK